MSFFDLGWAVFWNRHPGLILGVARQKPSGFGRLIEQLQIRHEQDSNFSMKNIGGGVPVSNAQNICPARCWLHLCSPELQGLCRGDLLVVELSKGLGDVEVHGRMPQNRWNPKNGWEGDGKFLGRF